MIIPNSSLQSPNKGIRLARAVILCIGISVFLGACASKPQRSGPIKDPYENINRKKLHLTRLKKVYPTFSVISRISTAWLITCYKAVLIVL